MWSQQLITIFTKFFILRGKFLDFHTAIAIWNVIFQLTVYMIWFHENKKKEMTSHSVFHLILIDKIVLWKYIFLKNFSLNFVAYFLVNYRLTSEFNLFKTKMMNFIYHWNLEFPIISTTYLTSAQHVCLLWMKFSVQCIERKMLRLDNKCEC